MEQKVTILTKFKVLIQFSVLRNIFTAFLKEIMLYILYRYRHRYRRYQKNDIDILSVSADKKIVFIGLYRYRPI